MLDELNIQHSTLNIKKIAFNIKKNLVFRVG